MRGRSTVCVVSEETGQDGWMQTTAPQWALVARCKASPDSRAANSKQQKEQPRRMCVGASRLYLLRLREVKQSDICVTCNRHKTNGLKLL